MSVNIKLSLSRCNSTPALSSIFNKTGLQPVSRPVEQVHYFGGWEVSEKSSLFKVLSCQDFTDRQIYRTGSGVRCIKVGTKVTIS